MKASFKLEQGIGLNNHAELITHGTDYATVGGNREAWVGLSGGFGGLTLGNQYSNAFFIVAAADPLNLNSLDVGQKGTSTIPVASQTNTISYTLPSIVSGLNITFQKRNATDGSTGALSNTGTDGGTSVGATYASGPLLVGVATDTISGLNTTTTGAAYDLGVAKLSVSNVNRAYSATVNYTNTQLGVSVPVSDALRLAYSSTSHKEGTAAAVSSSQIGAFYNLSKRTQAYLINGSSASVNTNVTAVGINHAF